MFSDPDNYGEINGSATAARQRARVRYMGLAVLALALAVGAVYDMVRADDPVRLQTATGQKLAGHRESRGNLGLDYGSGERRGYAFIMQILERSEYGKPEPPRVVLELDHDPSWGPKSDWEWFVKNPNDNVLKHGLTFKWYGQASCPDDLTSLQLKGPGGTLTQSPLNNPVAGYFEYQSVSVDRVKNLCVNWATNNNCDPIEPGCQLQETFNLFDDVAAQPGDYLELSGSCATDQLPTTQYLPKVEVLCLRGNF